jgi:hypothetical protein
MPLSLGQIALKAIVDWNVEWVGDKEKPRNPIRRGMIVRLDGDPAQEHLEGLWVTFGKEIGKDQVEINGVTVRCIKVAPRELNLVADCQSRMAAEAWKRTFQIPDQVGTIYESRAVRSGKPKLVDELQLTGAASQGPIADGPSPVKEEDDK